MKIFGRKGTTDANRRERAAKQKQGQPSASHRVTLDLYRAEVLASMMAKSRSSDSVEVTDLLAGMYISNWERISRYWEDSKQEENRDASAKDLPDEPSEVWHSWIESLPSHPRR